MNRELWIIETSFDGINWRPEIDLVYETGQKNAEADAEKVMASNPGLKARATCYRPVK